MKRFVFLTLLAEFLGSGQLTAGEGVPPSGSLENPRAAAQPEASPYRAPQPRPPEGNRYLFVVDTSSGMRRLDLPNRQTLFDLVYFGVDHQMRSNDTFGLWTFDAKLHSGEYPMQVWNSNDTLKIASSATTFLKQKRYGGKCDINPVIMSIQGIAKVVKDVNVFMLSNGETEIHGTPLDELINGLYKQRAAEARKAEKPLITTLIVREGVITKAQVTLPGEKIEIPLPPPPPEPALAQTNAPVKGGQVISERVLEPGEDASGAATWIRSQPMAQPLIMKGKSVPISPTGNFASDSRSLTYRATNQTQLVSTITNTETKSAEPANPIAAVPATKNSSSATAVMASNATASGPSVVTSLGEKGKPATGGTVTASVTAASSVSLGIPNVTISTPASTDGAREVSASAQAVPLGPGIAVPAQSNAVSQGETGTASKSRVVATAAPQPWISPQFLITVGCVMLVLALGLLALVFRHLRRLPEPSIITRSLEKR